MSNYTRSFLTIAVALLGAGLATLTDVVPVSLQSWQVNVAAALVVAGFTTALWFGSESAHGWRRRTGDAPFPNRAFSPRHRRPSPGPLARRLSAAVAERDAGRDLADTNV